MLRKIGYLSILAPDGLAYFALRLRIYAAALPERMLALRVVRPSREVAEVDRARGESLQAMQLALA
jgi:hypothetical protein